MLKFGEEIDSLLVKRVPLRAPTGQSETGWWHRLYSNVIGGLGVGFVAVYSHYLSTHLLAPCVIRLFIVLCV